MQKMTLVWTHMELVFTSRSSKNLGCALLVPLRLSKGLQRTPGAAETAWPHITDPPLSPGSLSESQQLASQEVECGERLKLKFI